MAKKVVNERAKPGSGVKHDKHAPTNQRAVAATEETEETESAPTAKSNKADILAYCEDNNIDVDSSWNKAELLDAISESA